MPLPLPRVERVEEEMGTRDVALRARTAFPLLSFVLPLVLFLMTGCTPAPHADATPVQTGAQQLAEQGFEELDGLRVGLIVNHTARVDTAHLIDRIDRAPNVELGALFGPEHGLRGTAGAGVTVDDGVDDRTGAPVYSLYGETRQPTPAMLADLDALVFDIQDVGARFYTYITTMGLAMQAAAAAGLPFIVLDRPNPLGGAYVSGFIRPPEHDSFVGAYPIPIAHGMTVGELARMIQGEGWMSGLDALDLRVVPMAGWSRSMRWPATGLDWIAPSPNLPSPDAALVYPGACFFEATAASEGRGTDQPFLQLGRPMPAATAETVTDTLNARELAGVRFEPVAFTPRDRPGAMNPQHEGEPLHGIRYVLTDATAFAPVETGIHVLHAFYHHTGDGLITRPDWLATLAGTTELQDMLQSGAAPGAIIASWNDGVDTFRAQRAPYLLY